MAVDLTANTLRLDQTGTDTERDLKRRAARNVALLGRDVADRRQLLEALGLIPRTDTTKGEQ